MEYIHVEEQWWFVTSKNWDYENGNHLNAYVPTRIYHIYYLEHKQHGT
jgi:hypothetical protein